MRVEFRPLHDSPRMPGQIMPQAASRELLLANLNPNLPHEFIDAAHRAVGYMNELDQDPQTAIQQPRVQVFVQELAGSGFVGGPYILKQTHTLPLWLRPDFLNEHGLALPKPLTESEQSEVGRLFEAASAPFQHSDNPHGRYFRANGQVTPRNDEHFKYYIESHELLSMLCDGEFEKVLGDLEARGLSPSQFKLFEDERLVLYFGQAVTIAGSQVRDVIALHGVRGRGPAQDVYAIISDEHGRLRTEVTNSNDGALGDGGHNPVEYEATSYDPGNFAESYLRLCLYAGKDPAEPYRTSFVYLLGRDSSEIEEARRMTAYPVVVSRSQASMPLVAGK